MRLEAQPFVPLAEIHEQSIRIGMGGRPRQQPFVRRRAGLDARVCDDGDVASGTEYVQGGAEESGFVAVLLAKGIKEVKRGSEGEPEESVVVSCRATDRRAGWSGRH